MLSCRPRFTTTAIGIWFILTKMSRTLTAQGRWHVRRFLRNAGFFDLLRQEERREQANIPENLSERGDPRRRWHARHSGGLAPSASTAARVRARGDQKSRERKNQGDKEDDTVTLNSRGNSVDYILARLEREGLTHWVEAVRARRVSAFAAAVELGWAKRSQTLHGEDCNQARLRRRAVVDIKSLIG